MRSDKKKKWTWMRILGILVVISVIAGGGYTYSVYKSLKSAVDTMNQPIDREKSEKREEPVTINNKKQPFSVLMLGVDERKGDRGRSDSIIVLTVNPTLKSVKMLSIPRDTRTEIVGKGKDDKINHAYAFGGIPMSMNTVENFLDIPIDYYMQVNMEGFKDIVDAVGGITVNNTLDFTSGGEHFPIGKVTLNGEKALKYTRMRYEDPRGDFGRQSRQRLIIQEVINEGASISSLTSYSNIFEALSKNIKTNLTFEEMVNIQKYYKEAGTNIQQLEIKGTGTKIDKIYYLLVPEEEKQRIRNELKSHLEINN